MLGRLEKPQLPRVFYGADWSRTTSNSLVQIFSARIASMSSFSSAHHGALCFFLLLSSKRAICSRSWMHRWDLWNPCKNSSSTLTGLHSWKVRYHKHRHLCWVASKFWFWLGLSKDHPFLFFLVGHDEQFPCAERALGRCFFSIFKVALCSDELPSNCQRIKRSHCLYVSHGPWLKIFN